MREVEWELVPEPPWIIILTCHEISEHGKLLAADFRDTHALFDTKTGCFLGFRKDGKITPGVRSAVMRNGVWFTKENELVNFDGFDLSRLELSRIELPENSTFSG